MERNIFKTEVAGKNLEVDTRDLSERANGTVMVRFGDTTVLANCVMSEKDIESDFFPLSVSYEEKFYASGKILGSRFTRREGKPSDEAVLISRLIDRTIRPLFPENLKREVTVTVTCLSWDKETDPGTLGIFAASLCLLISDIPWNGPVAGVRVGENEGKFVAFPNYEVAGNGVDLVVAGLEDKGELIFNMIEAGLKEVGEEKIVEAINFSTDYCKKLLSFQKEILSKTKKEKIELSPRQKNDELEEEINKFLGDRLEKELENKELFNDLKEHLKDRDEDIRYAMHFLEKEIEKTMHEMILNKNVRSDGRGMEEIRELYCEVGTVPRVHGNGLFSRGQTRAFSFLTLGGPGDEKLLETLEFTGKKRFMHHYNFPPFSVGETGISRGPGRREIGHGRLGEKALMAVIPDFSVFPYTIRVVSEVLSSNGSSSMASTCAACLALMDGGVPIKAPVAGIAMGIIVEQDFSKKVSEREYRVITDIQGPEDHYGDMDFKVAGTKQGLTALQLDVKLEGVTIEMLKKGLEQAKAARMKILEKMAGTIKEPRKELSPYAPRVFIIKINPEKIREVIGPGGKMINQIIDECDVAIEIEDSGEVFITSESDESAKKAIEWIKNLTREIKVGEVFQGVVTRILNFGAFVEILPGQEGMVHISQLAESRVAKVEDVVKIGDSIPVKVVSIDEQGRINLSLKQAKK